MPSKRDPTENETDEKGYKNLTLRLPDEYHRQLSTQAQRRGLTLNAHLVGIVHRHLLESGFAPDVIKSFSGRLFEIEFEPITDRYPGFFCGRFDIYENNPLYVKRRAHYIFGLASSLVETPNPHGTLKDLGVALLNFYNRSGFEIDQLAWQAREKHPSTPSPKMKDNWRYIGLDTTTDTAQFMIALARNHWKDDLLVLTGQSQDLRLNLRTEEDLYR